VWPRARVRMVAGRRGVHGLASGRGIRPWRGRGLLVVVMLVASCGSGAWKTTRSDSTSSSAPSTSPEPLAVGGRWRTMAPAPAGADGAPVWTGRDLIVWSGTAQHNGEPVTNGFAYNLADDRWREIPGGPLRPRHGHTSV